MHHQSFSGGARLPIHEEPAPEGLGDDEIEVGVLQDDRCSISPKLQMKWPEKMSGRLGNGNSSANAPRQGHGVYTRSGAQCRAHL